MRKKKIKKIIIAIVVCASILVGLYCVHRFIVYYQNMCIEVEERVIRWYIDNNKPPYQDFDTYEDYLEYRANGDESLKTPY